MRCLLRRTGGISLVWLRSAIPSLPVASRLNKSLKLCTTARGEQEGFIVCCLGFRVCRPTAQSCRRLRYARSNAMVELLGFSALGFCTGAYSSGVLGFSTRVCSRVDA